MVHEQQEQVRERERIEQELRTAQAIQHAFLSRDVPALPGWQLMPYYRPAHEVGGDFYDIFVFADGRLGLVIGDVAGKGGASRPGDGDSAHDAAYGRAGGDRSGRGIHTSQ